MGNVFKITFVLILLCHSVSAQESIQPGKFVTPLIYEQLRGEVAYNIYSYNSIKYYLDTSCVDSLGFVKNVNCNEDMYKSYRNYRQILDLKFQGSEMKYPDSTFKIVEVNLPAVRWVDICDSSLSSMVGFSDLEIVFSRRFLVAFKTSNNKLILKYISGSFLKNAIWNDFKTNGYTSDNLIHYLKFKAYNLEIEKVNFNSVDTTWYKFDVILNNRKGNAIWINKSNPDFLLLLNNGKPVWKNTNTYEQGLWGNW